jgi:16S rRNA (uracil1498-N3)-methyltransferase
VLRLNAGDRLELIDSAGASFDASIDTIGTTVRATLLERIAESGALVPLQIDVAQAVPKGQRMEFVVEKCTELGASAFIPFYCERSVSRDLGAEKLARWQRLARTAAQQSGRRDVPRVLAPLDFGGLIARFGDYQAVLFAWELAPPISLRERLPAALTAAERILVVVGPEGGFTHAEAELAQLHGAVLVWLGARILRTDTAAIVLMAVIAALAS